MARKIIKNRERIAKWCSYFQEIGAEPETPRYDKEGIRRLIQSSYDLITERNKIRHRLHKTNMKKVKVPVLNDETMTIDEVIILTTLSIPQILTIFKTLRRKEKTYQQRGDNSKVIIQYDPEERDKEIDSLEDLQEKLNSFLDTINITTELEE